MSFIKINNNMKHIVDVEAKWPDGRTDQYGSKTWDVLLGWAFSGKINQNQKASDNEMAWLAATTHQTESHI